MDLANSCLLPVGYAGTMSICFAFVGAVLYVDRTDMNLLS